MHAARVRYFSQLKTIEERHKLVAIEKKFDHFENDFCTVQPIETEIDLDY